MMRIAASSLLLSVLVVALGARASAQTTWDNGGPDRDWNNPLNWTSTVDPPVAPPDETVKANVWSAPGPVISSPTAAVRQVDLGTAGGTAIDIETGGTLTVNDWFIIGYGGGTEGTLNINGGTATQPVGNNLTVGRQGTGNVTMTAGSLSLVGDLFIGGDAAGTGHFTIGGAGSSVTADDLFVGRNGTGTLDMTGGSLTVNDDVFVGDGSTSNGEATMSGGTISNFDDLIVGNAVSSSGTMTMSGGVIESFDKLGIGLRGTGVMTMNGAGGTITTNGLLMVGEVAGADGTLVMESGSIMVGTLFYVGFNGTGLLEMTGGSISAPNGPLVIGRNNGSSGQVLLKGGTITAGALEFDNEGTSLLSHMDITGGTLILGGDRQGLVNGYIDAGYLTGYGAGGSLIVAYDADADLTTVTATASSFHLTITPNGANYNFTWESKPGKLYDLVSATDLTLPPADWPVYMGHENIDDTAPTNFLTDVPGSGSERFFAVLEKDPPPLLSEDFESGDGGFTIKLADATGSAWDHGLPDSVGEYGGSVTSGNADSTLGCWGTNLGDFTATADRGYYADPTVTCLRSPVIDLTSVAGAQLTFAEALDVESNDTAVVNIIDDTTDTIIAAAVYTAIDPNGSAADWAAANNGSAIDLSAGIGQMVRIEWCLDGTGGAADDYIGWYIDDVEVTVTLTNP